MAATDQLAAYLARDRLVDLAGGDLVPARADGTVLFADISGFTALTAGLSAAWGVRRGAGELSRLLETVYGGLIEAVDAEAGSVISFAGDAILCWFGHRTAGAHRAAERMLAFVSALPPLDLPGKVSPRVAIRVVLASGSVGRLVVGDSSIQKIDVMTGAPVEWVAEQAKMLASGSLEMDDETRTRLRHPEPLPSTTASASSPSPEVLQSWVLPAVWNRETAGLGAFLPEFRPTVALFLRFVGLNLDDPLSSEPFGAFVRAAQRALDRREGTLLHVEVGDKGNYLYAAFGAPHVHTDDGRRAVQTAAELRTLAAEAGCFQPVQVGISRGIMRTGRYGASTRGCYSALGEEVNIAARLMEAAPPGEIWLTGRVVIGLGAGFGLQNLGVLPIRGQPLPIPAFRLVEEAQSELLPPMARDESLPLMGRGREFQTLRRALEATRQGRGGVWVIEGDAGIGKTRLAEELRWHAAREGYSVFQGQAFADSQRDSWHAWRPVWAGLFGRAEYFVNRLADRSEDLPLLGPLLGIDWPDPQGNRMLSAQDREAATLALVTEGFRRRLDEPDLRRDGILIVLDDGHWMDPASRELLWRLASASGDRPVLFVLTTRPSDFSQEASRRLGRNCLVLPPLPRQAAKELLVRRAKALYASGRDPLPASLREQLLARAQGNAFFLEELVRFLHYRGFHLGNPGLLQNHELPDSVHTLILGRLDRLEVAEQSTLKAAAVLGLRFSPTELACCFPELGTGAAVDSRLDRLAEWGFLQPRAHVQGPSQEFQHPLTHEAVYESLDSGARAQLHHRYALWLENQDTERPGHLDALARHFDRGLSPEKAQKYLESAARAAAQLGQTAAAAAWYRRLLERQAPGATKDRIKLDLAEILELQGNWDAALDLCRNIPGAESLIRQATLLRKLTLLDEAEPLLERVLADAVATKSELCGALLELTQVALARRDLEAAAKRIASAQVLGLRQAEVARVMATIALKKHDYAGARSWLDRSLTLSRQAGDKRGQADGLYQLALVYHNQNDLLQAERVDRECLALFREIGDRQKEGWTLHHLAIAVSSLERHDEADALYTESLAMAEAMGDQYALTVFTNNIGTHWHEKGKLGKARRLYLRCLDLSVGAKDPLMKTYATSNLALVEARLGHVESARQRFAEALELCREISEVNQLAYAQMHHALFEGRQGTRAGVLDELERARNQFEQLKQVTMEAHCDGAWALLACEVVPFGDELGEAAAALLKNAEVRLKLAGVPWEAEFRGPVREAKRRLEPWLDPGSLDPDCCRERIRRAFEARP